MKEENIIWLKEISEDDIGKVGGKAAHLGEMTKIGNIPIPASFVVTAQAYKKFLEENDIEDEIYSILNELDVDDADKLHEAAERVQEIILSAEIPSEIKNDILEAYDNLNVNIEVFKRASKEALDIIRAGRDMPFVAVRSSATAEDLPNASFAGQQATFLNVKGNDNLLKAVQKCMASLFTARAIYYRVKNNFPHEKVFIAVIVQKMVNSAASGVIFTANPTTNNLKEIVIEAGYGLGEAVVSGSITPDSYILDKESLQIKEKKINKQNFAIIREINTGKNVKRTLFEEEGSQQKLTDHEIKKLSRYAVEIENYYKKPQDIEFAIENSSIFIVQTRAITTIKEEIKREEFESKEKPILEGIAASPYIGSGPVKIIRGPEELNKIMQGDVLVTKMTNPDYTAGMQKAAAIVTDEGGRTSHAAIVSREMGISCVVGTMKATEILKDNELVTVDGASGKVYSGKIQIVKGEREEGKELKVSESEEGEKIEEKISADTKVYMNLSEPEEIERYKNLEFEGIGLFRIEFMIADKIREHPNSLIEKGEEDKYIDGLSDGILKVAETINGKPLIVRFSDFKTNEYRDLIGGEEFEPNENNPLMGWRGVSRYISEEFEKSFRLECRAIKNVRERVNNVHAMLPFVRTTWEVEKVLEIMKEEGLERSENFKILLMAEVPSMALIPEEFAKLDIDGCSIGSNDLSSLILGVDRDSAILGKMGYFDERNLAVLKGIKNIIKGFKKNGKSVSICGQAPSSFPEFVEFLVKEGIDSISVNPDVVDETKRLVEESKEKMVLDSIT